MAMTKSVFPPSISDRLIHCPGSRRIGAGFDVIVSDDCGEFLCGDRADKELQEGVECHMLAAYKLKKALLAVFCERPPEIPRVIIYNYTMIFD